MLIHVEHSPGFLDLISKLRGPLDICRAFVDQPLERDFCFEPTVRGRVVRSGFAPGNFQVPVCGITPAQGVWQPGCDFGEIGCSFDWVRNGRQADIRLDVLDMGNGRFDIRNVFTLVAPHYEHAGFDAR